MSPSRGIRESRRTHQIGHQRRIRPEDPKQLRDPPGTDVPIELQQRVLDLFKDAFVDELDPNLASNIRQVKQHLYNRDFNAAFGTGEYHIAYAAHWSPSRALGYLQLFSDMFEDISIPKKKVEETSYAGTASSFQGDNFNPIRVACLGAGAGAEIAAFAAHLHHLNSRRSNNEPTKLDLIVVDSADWSFITESLCQVISQPPKISAYASSTVKAANIPLANPGLFTCRFQHSDLLKLDLLELQTVLQAVDLVTLMFTLNELYSTSLSQTQRFLLQMGTCLKKGARFLVVDSPGSYSTVQLNGKEKRYPMQWLLDHTLVREGISDADATQWKKLVSDDSKWFRLINKGLLYPIDLEFNMRFQIHLYQKV